ncbi:MAG TPA: hydrogenase nickel incorporation protein HypB [Gammaproteobacteria bacterium]
MCDSCGCNVTPGNKHLLESNGKLSRTPDGKLAITVLQGLLSENDRQAQLNREHFDRHRVLVINMMSSPGSGKTALLEATIEAIGPELNIGVIEGDLETERDAERIRAKGVPAIQITTGSACHLDAHMVHNALHQLDLGRLDLLFIENVGNLVCPASFDLGHHRNVTLLSVTEGDDKPAKYPVMFRAADAMLITKADLLRVLDDFQSAAAEHYLRNLANPAPVLEVSAKTRQGLTAWFGWLQQELQRYHQYLAQGKPLYPRIQPQGQAAHAAVYVNHQLHPNG